MRKARKIFLYCSWIPALISMGIYTVLENNYVGYPRVPDAATGRVVPHTAKGVVVFITQGQSTFIQAVVWILLVSGALTLVGAVANQIWPLRDDKT